MEMDSIEDLFGDDYEELVLSQGAESLPSALDLGSPTLTGEVADWDIPELPLSQEANLPGETPAEQTVARSQATTEQGSIVPGEAMIGADASQPGPPPKRRSIMSGRGRPNQVLRQAMREAMVEFGVSSIGDSGSAGSSGDGGLELVLPKQELGVVTASQLSLEDIAATKIENRSAGALVPAPMSCISLPPPVQSALVAALRCARRDSSTIDPTTVRVAQLFLGDEPLALASKALRAESLGIDPKKLSKMIPRLACGSLQMELGQRRAIEGAVVTRLPRKELLFYVDFCSYDETPLRVALRGDKSSVISPAQPVAQQPALADVPSGALSCDLRGESVLVQKLKGSQGPQKIMQTVQRSGMLFRTPRGDLSMLLCPTTSSLCAMSAGSADCVKATQLRVSGVTAAAVAFQRQARVVCTDKHPSNLAAERDMARGRSGDWSLLHIECEVHKTSGCYTKTFALLEDNVKGMIHCALSLQSGSAMSRFRACLKEEIASRFEVLHGQPSRDAINYKEQMMRIFVQHGAHVPMRQILLAVCPNGDWRSAKVQYYVQQGPGQPQTEEAMLEHVTAGLVTALAASQPELYPRHRWTGADLATDSLGIIETVHQLLSTTYVRFASSFESGVRARALASSLLPPPGHGIAAPMPAMQDAPAEDAGASVAGASAQASSASANAAQDSEASAPSGEQPAWAVINAAHRRITATWLATQPLKDIILQRLTMEPLRWLLTRQFDVASDQWELRQQQQALRTFQEGGGDAGRDYRVTRAAEGSDERMFFTQLSLLFEKPALWWPLPADAFTVAFRAKSFSMLARMGCCVHQLLQHPHEQFPFRLFLLLKKPEMAKDMVKTEPCRLGEWTKSMLQDHPTLTGDVFHAKLGLVALLLWKDISVVESKHASLRRMLHLASLQTHQQDFSELAASWCFHQFRKNNAPKVQKSTRQRTRAKKAGCQPPSPGSPVDWCND